MKTNIVFISFLLLSACSYIPKENKIEAVVKAEVKIKVAKVSEPSKLVTPTFKFQAPSEKTSVIAMDAENYQNFRQFLLAISARESKWQSKLIAANEIIDTLNK